MSALRQDLHDPSQPELGMREEMSLIASGRATSKTDAWIDFLNTNAVFAKRLGRKADRMRATFAKAYPGATRTRRFTNDQWIENGFDYVARVNHLMGRTDS